MVPRVVASLFVALVFLPLLAVPVDADFHDGFATVLRVWHEPVPSVHLETLRLDPDEGHGAYFFKLVPTDPAAPVAGHVSVRAFGDREPTCRGPLAAVAGKAVHEPCNGLRVATYYEVEWTATAPDVRLVLYGHDP